MKRRVGLCVISLNAFACLVTWESGEMGEAPLLRPNLGDQHITTCTVNESTTVLPPPKCHWRCKRAATAKPKTGRAKKTMT